MVFPVVCINYDIHFIHHYTHCTIEFHRIRSNVFLMLTSKNQNISPNYNLAALKVRLHLPQNLQLVLYSIYK